MAENVLKEDELKFLQGLTRHAESGDGWMRATEHQSEMAPDVDSARWQGISRLLIEMELIEHTVQTKLRGPRVQPLIDGRATVPRPQHTPLVRATAKGVQYERKIRRESEQANVEPGSKSIPALLGALRRLETRDKNRWWTAAEVTQQAEKGADPDALKGVFSNMRAAGLVKSKRGRGGGYKLTPRGRARAIEESTKPRKKPKKGSD